MPQKKRHPGRVPRLMGEPGPGALAVGYVRFSSELRNQATLDAQRRAIQDYADQKGWKLVRWYEEPEQSVNVEGIEQRLVFAQLLRDAGEQFQVVLCYTNSHWSRSLPVAYSTLARLRQLRVWWATADGLWNIDQVAVGEGLEVIYSTFGRHGRCHWLRS